MYIIYIIYIMYQYQYLLLFSSSLCLAVHQPMFVFLLLVFVCLGLVCVVSSPSIVKSLVKKYAHTYTPSHTTVLATLRIYVVAECFRHGTTPALFSSGGNRDHTLTNRLTSLLSSLLSLLPSFLLLFLPSFLPSLFPLTNIPCLERNSAVLFLSALHGALKITDSPSIPLLRRKIICLALFLSWPCPASCILRPACFLLSLSRCVFDLKATHFS